MKRIHLSLPLAVLILWGTWAGCAPANVLTIPRDLAREASPPAAGTGEGAAVAVLDFSWSGPPSGEIGRDFDLVRPIVWNGNPGKSIADLIAHGQTRDKLVERVGEFTLMSDIGPLKGYAYVTPFDRVSAAAQSGRTAAWVLAGDPSPVASELDAIQPSIALVMFGTNDIGWYDDFGATLRW